MSEQYTAKGTVKVIGEIQTFANDFTKRELVITTNDEKYPQDVKFEFIKDKCAELDKVNIGQECTVHFNLRGNEYNSRYYVNLGGWKLEAGEGFAPNEQPDEEEDDIPF